MRSSDATSMNVRQLVALGQGFRAIADVATYVQGQQGRDG